MPLFLIKELKAQKCLKWKLFLSIISTTLETSQSFNFGKPIYKYVFSWKIPLQSIAWKWQFTCDSFTLEKNVKNSFFHHIYRNWPFINKIRRQSRGRGFSKCLWYYISLCSKIVYEGGRRGVKFLEILST